MMQPGQMPPTGQSGAPAPAPGGGNTITIDMTPGAITISGAQGSKQCESIGECLQTLLEMYEGMAGQEGEGAFEAGYADQAPQDARPINGTPMVK